MEREIYIPKSIRDLVDISPQRKIQLARKAAGLCERCGNGVRDKRSKAYCRECLILFRERARRTNGWVGRRFGGPSYDDPPVSKKRKRRRLFPDTLEAYKGEDGGVKLEVEGKYQAEYILKRVRRRKETDETI